MVSSVILIDILSRALGIFRFLINPKLLGAEAYGRLGYVSAILVFAAFCDLGMNREFELALPRALNPVAVTREAILRLLARALLPALLLCGVVAYTTDFGLGMLCLPYVLLFGFIEIFLIVFRAYKFYWVLNSYSLISAAILTFSTFWIAPLFGVAGILGFQSIISIFSVLVLALVLYAEAPKFTQGSTRSDPLTAPLKDRVSVSKGAHWLFLGQLTQVAWIVADRILLAHRISQQEMGYWTLGSLPGSVLTGMATTLGALHMASWIKRERRFFFWPEALGYGLAWFVGMLIYVPFVRHFLPAYASGITWNIRLILLQGSLGILFYYDCYRRSQIQDTKDSLDWFLRRLTVSALGLGFVFLGRVFFSQTDPRAVVLLGLHFLLVCLWSFERRWGLLGLQLVLGCLSVTISF